MDRVCFSVSLRDNIFDSKFCIMTSRPNHVHKPIYAGGNVIKCKICGVNVTCKVSLARLAIDEITEIFQCKKCDETFVIKAELERHVLTHIKEKRERFKCNECNKYFFCKSLLKIHSRGHTGERRFSCQESNKHYSTKRNLDQHLLSHPDEFPLDFRSKKKNKMDGVCLSISAGNGTPKPKCSVTTRRPNHVHKPIYTGGNMIKCESCAVNLTCKVSLKRLIFDESGEIFYCKDCDKVLSLASDLQRHLLAHDEKKEKKRFKCEKCHKYFSCDTRLKIHLRIHTGKISYSCRKCNKHYSTKGKLDQHLLSHPDRFPLNFRCRECKKYFTGKSGLKRHEKIHANEKNFKCGQCNKYFAKKEDLKNHEKIHGDEKLFKCADCDKSFAQKSSLILHVRIHTGEKPYKCEKCNKCFSQKGNLEKPRETHSGEKNFKFEECDKYYTRKSSLNTHKKIHNEETNFKCGECNKCFTKKDHLRKHEKIHSVERHCACRKCDKFHTSESYLKAFLRKFMMEEKISSLDSVGDTLGEEEENSSQQSTENEDLIEDVQVQQNSTQQVISPQKEITNVISQLSSSLTNISHALQSPHLLSQAEEENCWQHQPTGNEAPIEDGHVEQNSMPQVSGRQEEIAKNISLSPFSSANSSCQLDIAELLSRAPWLQGKNISQQLTGNMVPVRDTQFWQSSTQQEIPTVILQSTHSYTILSCKSQATQLLPWDPWNTHNSQQSTENDIQILDKQVQHGRTQQVSSPQEEITSVILESPFSLAKSTHELQPTQLLSRDQEENTSQQSTENMLPVGEMQFQQISTRQVTSPQEEITNVISQSSFTPTNSSHELQTIQLISRVEEEHSYSSQRSRENEVPIEDGQVKENSMQQVSSPEEEEYSSQQSTKNEVRFEDKLVQQNDTQEITSWQNEIVKEISPSPPPSPEWKNFFEEERNPKRLRLTQKPEKKKKKKQGEKNQKSDFDITALIRSRINKFRQRWEKSRNTAASDLKDYEEKKKESGKLRKMDCEENDLFSAVAYYLLNKLAVDK